MTPVSYYARHEISSPKFAFAFARGCKGEISDDLDYLFPGPFAAFGSPPVWPLLRRAQAEGRDWYFADHGYLGRGVYFRITKNNYQHDGSGYAAPERWKRFGRPIKPWRTSGRHIVVCPNSEVYCRLHGFDVMHWLQEVQRTVRAHTRRPIKVRWKKDSGRNPLQRDLVNAWAVVVYSSAAAIEALLSGVPVFTLAPFAATYQMGLSDLSQIEHPIYPDDRERFMEVIAANQWTLPEIFNGDAWRALQTPREVAA